MLLGLLLIDLLRMVLVLSFFIEASILFGDLDFDFLVFHSVTRGGCTVVFVSKPTAWLGPRGGTSSLCEAASSEFALGADEPRLPWQWQHQLRMRLGELT